MASLLDQRPAPRSAPLFGRALVAVQESERKARADAESARIARDREARMEQAQKVAEQQRAEALRLSTEALRIRQIEMGAKLAEAQATLNAKEVDAQTRKVAMEQYGKAAIALGKLDPKSPEYDLRVAEIQAEHPDAFTFDEKIAKSLNNLIESKTKARDLFITNNEKIAADEKKKADAAAQMEQAKAAGLSPTQAVIDGFTFKKLEEPKSFNSFEEAQKAHPDARITGTLDSTGKFIVNEIGTKAGSGGYGSDLLPADQTTKPVTPAPGKPALSDIFK